MPQSMTKPNTSPSYLAYVPEWIAQQFYRHGLFCASQPLAVLVFAFVGILWACYPLLTIQVYSGDAKIWLDEPDQIDKNHGEKPRWLEKQPVGYIQQIIMKAAVHPYTEDLLRNDAFRGPLATAFKLHLSDVAGFIDKKTGLDMDHECMRTDGLAPRYRTSLSHLLPDYGCLILSPANIWGKDPTTYQEDGNIVDTVFNFQRSREGHSSLADIMFGLRQRDTGLTKYPVNNRQRTITYSVTVLLRQNKPHFISALKNHLKTLYPLYSDGDVNNTKIVHIHFPERFNGAEYIPYTLTIGMLFFYVYYSFSKVELVQSKAGIALTAVITILGSLFMSLGLTGLSLGGNGYVYTVPYLVAALGLENILVVTRSVVSTPAHLDVKVRVAQGLSREGWNITQSLFSEITVLTLGFFLGILDSSIQEFCLLAVMGLLADFYLQTFFFITVLSMDISRTKLVDVVQKQSFKKTFQHPVSGPGFRISREGQVGMGLVAPPLSQPGQRKLPKRVQIFNFWAQRRVVSRFFIAAMMGWIAIFIYQTGLVETLLRGAGWVPAKEKSPAMDLSGINKSSPMPGGAILSAINGKATAENISNIISAHPPEGIRKIETLTKLQYKDSDYWKRLPYSHWPMLFGLYNISVYGDHLALLPPILLSTVISPEAVVKLRSPNEKDNVGDHPVWDLEKIKSALEIGDDDDLDDSMDINDDGPELSPFVPTSPGELLLAFALAVPSILFLVYLSIVCYRFVCTKNYAEWRSGYNDSVQDFCTQIVQEGAPLSLQGHTQDIETLVTDGHLVLSHCLAGGIVVWDSLTGDTVTSIDRKNLPNKSKEAQSFIDNLSAAPNSLPKTGKSKLSSQKNEIKSRKSKSTNFRKFTEAFHEVNQKSLIEEETNTPSVPSIWCIDMSEGLIIIGCDSGKIEVWDASSGDFMCEYDDGRCNAVSHVKLVAGRLIVARIDGNLDFLELVSFGTINEQQAASKSRIRLLSSHSNDSLSSYGEDLRLAWKHSSRAHMQSITCMVVQGTKLITGSQDHTLRVFRCDDGVGVYTLHGHCGPITSVFIDRLTPSTAGSASLDGMLCVWDLLTGACMYSIQAHDGAVISLTYSPSYVVSLGADGKLCVWERFQGHLINSVDTTSVGESDCPDLVMLTHNLIVTGKNGFLVVWDCRLTEPVKIVRLGHSDGGAASVNIIKQIGDTIICTFGPQIRLVRFPMLTDKLD